MKNIFIRISAISLILASLASCESRKDVFRPLDEGPKVLFSLDAREYVSRLDVSLRSEEDVLLHYRLRGEYPYSLSSALTLDEYIWTPGDSTEKDSKTEDVEVRVNDKDSTILIRSLRPKRTWTKEEVYKRLTFSLLSEDVYGKVSEAGAGVSVSSYRALWARVDSVTFDTSEPRVKVSASFDSNAYGDRAVAYEYLFDGDIMFDADGWENDDHRSYNANPGQAAKGGYYITSTPLTEVRHVFQSGGTHTFAVRCKSSNGMWGRWTRHSLDLDSGEWR